MAFSVDAPAVARLERLGWEAYYERAWGRTFWRLVQLNRVLYHMGPAKAVSAAFDTVRAAQAFAPLDNDPARVREHLTAFYTKALAGIPARVDAAILAARELEYWQVHRELAIGRLHDSQATDIEPLVAALARLHAAHFDGTEQSMRASAAYRARATAAVDRITGGYSQDIAADWAAAEELLCQAYMAANQAMTIRKSDNKTEERATTPASSNDYHFVTLWRVRGQVEEVAAILRDADDLVRWWPSVYLEVETVEAGDDHRVGKVVNLFTKGWLPYTLRWSFRVTEVSESGFRLEAWGDFVGRGIWRFEQAGDYANITYDWKIRADKPLLRYLSFLFKPIFSANHRWAMARGEESLALELARRHAASAAERERIPPPPGPTFRSRMKSRTK